MNIPTPTPSTFIHHFLASCCLDVQISFEELLENESFCENYQAAITHLSACSYEIQEQGIWQADIPILYRDRSNRKAKK